MKQIHNKKKNVYKIRIYNTYKNTKIYIEFDTM